ncbi:hypothetical protein CONCODRAFT_17245 [Conidiobolus coronatus NRRL 28638]|uniref:Uncharacterized protein n=1 Tax=Conidiobolus coronatus (strain ATCC 28846 / CBS 209.66 / NRRL 28638) TaxID=796925 RepID=A0A137P7T2_CONC2|nr:hypothetical protein CONCODRAFT_17245 [Conidiobolus coronatus NRRL 28638]|eukprot:KXN70981.1 hypothetical protein CONCODRAFT_17245 [Conidiobolus coronatus NRRL 28638]
MIEITTYPTSKDLECIDIILSNTIYSIVLAQGLIPLVHILVSNEDEVTLLTGFIIIGIVTVVLGLIALISQLKEVKLRDINDHNTFDGDDIEEGRRIQSQDKDTRINNYLALNS